MAEIIDDPRHTSSIQTALQAFLNAETREEMQTVLDEHPFVGGPAFEAAAQRLVDHAAASGDPEAMFRIQNRLELLYEVQEASHASPVERAMEAFLNAAEAEAARQVYIEHADLLATDTAAQILRGLEAGDPESLLFLQERRDLYRELRRGVVQT